MNATQEANLNQAIKLLQSLLAGTTLDKAGPIDIPIPEYDSQIQAFYQKAQTLQPQLQKLTEIYKKASATMKKILSYSQVYKKYSPAQQQKLKNLFISLSNQIQPLKKNPNFIDQCNAIKELLSSTFWVFIPTPEFIVKGAIEGADYNALKFQKKKVKQHNDWWALVSGACKTLQKFVAKQYPMGLNFNPKGEEKWDQLLSGDKIQSTKSNTQQKFAQQKPKESETQKIVKKAKKQLNGMTWQISHHQNQQINLQAEVQMKHGVFIENCNNCKINVDSKSKSIQLIKCENAILTVKGCVSGVEIMNSKNISIIIKEKSPSISVDNCERVNILLNDSNADIDIVSFRASELNVSIGEDSKQHLISEQLITKWNPKVNKFETKVYDKFL